MTSYWGFYIYCSGNLFSHFYICVSVTAWYAQQNTDRHKDDHPSYRQIGTDVLLCLILSLLFLLLYSLQPSVFRKRRNVFLSNKIFFVGRLFHICEMRLDNGHEFWNRRDVNIEFSLKYRITVCNPFTNMFLIMVGIKNIT